MSEGFPLDTSKLVEAGLYFREQQRDEDRKLVVLSLVAPEMLSEADKARVAALSTTDPELYEEFGLKPEVERNTNA
jgi:hypothetical protein